MPGHTVGKNNLTGLAISIVRKCNICGMIFTNPHDLEEHHFFMHNFTEQESSLLKRAGKQEKARKRTRGPYRKAHAA